MTDLTKLTPAEVDALIAAIHNRAAPHFAAAAARFSSARKYAAAGAHYAAQASDHEAAGKEARAKGVAITAEAKPHEEEYKRRGGWSRFFLCISDGGHIHRRHCSTLRVTTQIGWLPEMSGKTEEEAVAAYGTKMCTVCFPSAPTFASYVAAVAAEKAKEAAAASLLCPGSSTRNHDSNRMRFAYYKGGRCNVCKHQIGASSTGLLRKHTPEGKTPPKTAKESK